MKTSGCSCLKEDKEYPDASPQKKEKKNLQQVPGNLFGSQLLHVACIIGLTLIASSLYLKMKNRIPAGWYLTSHYLLKNCLAHTPIAHKLGTS